MTAKRSRIVILATLAAALAIAGYYGAAPAADDPQPTREELQARVEALESLIPDQAHIMSDVGYHFSNLWFAGRAENWPLADFYLGETKSHLHWAVRRIPIRKDNQGREVDLVHILEAFENTELAHLKTTIDQKDRAGFERVYRESLTTCYSCHKAADKPYLRPQVPDKPDARIVNFDPEADWPL